MICWVSKGESVSPHPINCLRMYAYVLGFLFFDIWYYVIPRQWFHGSYINTMGLGCEKNNLIILLTRWWDWIPTFFWLYFDSDVVNGMKLSCWKCWFWAGWEYRRCGVVCVCVYMWCLFVHLFGVCASVCWGWLNGKLFACFSPMFIRK